MPLEFCFFLLELFDFLPEVQRITGVQFLEFAVDLLEPGHGRVWLWLAHAALFLLTRQHLAGCSRFGFYLGFFWVSRSVLENARNHVYSCGMKRQIVVGTRGSTVALLEARSVVARLKEEWPETDFRLSTITAKGGGLAGSGDLERALTEERINIAVHALEDFPVVQAEGLELASIPRRLEARVALVGRAGCKSLATLPDGATIGLSGALRLALVKNFRPDLIVKMLEGDLDDRLEALVSGCDAVLISGSDLLRAELRNRIDELIAPDILLPAPGQGAVALEVRSEDSLGLECAYSIHHRVSDDRITAERAFLEGLGGNLRAPIGALAVIAEDGTLTLEGCIAAPDGSQVIRASIEGDPDEAEDLGFELADDVLKQGGEAILKLTA